MLIDTHAHLNLEPLVADWPQVALEAYAAGVENIIVPGATVASSQQAIRIAQANQTPAHIKATVGVHPEEVTQATTTALLNEWLTAVEKLAQEPSVAGIGEIGLDYHADSNHPDIIQLQKQLFMDQLTLAKERRLPVGIHTRRSQAIHDACECIRSVYGRQEFVGIFHCFTGTHSHLDQVKQLGAYIGVGGLITFPHNSSLRKVIRTMPLEHIVLETDSPWLTPAPRTDAINRPVHIPLIALKLAEVHAVPLSAVMQKTTNNALELY